jgi:predicted DNA-binding transcriptional regulator AlpA
MKKISARLPGPTYLSAPSVCERYDNRSHMWLERRLRSDPNFPKPIKIGPRRFFRLSDLEAYERQCAVASYD